MKLLKEWGATTADFAGAIQYIVVLVANATTYENDEEITEDNTGNPEAMKLLKAWRDAAP